MNLIYFLLLTFGISFAGFACIVMIPSAKSPETLTGLPFWLVTVWGPSLAAIILSATHGELADLLLRSIRVSTIPIEVWAIVIAPLIILIFLKPFGPEATTPLTIGVLLIMVVFNLILGPLGEELGWRGILQDQLNLRMGWLEASLLVGFVWFIWHVPLWTIDSPHAQISIYLFAIHCLLYAIIIGAAYTLSGGSILPAILLHLTFNLASNAAVFAGFNDPNTWFKTSIVPYAVLAAISFMIVYVKTGRSGMDWLLAGN